MKKNFTQAENKILTEIYRRLNYFNNGDVNENLLLLALPSDVKPIKQYDFIVPTSKEIPRALNWYKLTPKGKEFFKNYVTKNKLSEKVNNKLFNNEYIKEFNYSLID